MKKRILLITCFLIFSVCSAQSTEEPFREKTDPEMEILVDNISELASKVLDIFEPIAAKANVTSDVDHDNTYFVSFLLRDRRNKTGKNDDPGLQRMVVNNNFSGDKLGSNQVFVESGPPPKQPPAHNIQLLNNHNDPLPMSSHASPHSPYQHHQQPYHHQQPNRHQQSHYG